MAQVIKSLFRWCSNFIGNLLRSPLIVNGSYVCLFEWRPEKVSTGCHQIGDRFAMHQLGNGGLHNNYIVRFFR